MAMTAIEAWVQLLADFGVRYIFGNPGTTELPLVDGLAKEDRIQYVLGLQEVPVVAMADGYAMASGRLGVVNVHISCGLGNAMGMLYNAWCEGTPLLVTAGQQDRRLLLEEPVLAGDLVSVTRPWTKWAVEVQRPEDLPTALRRAVQTALTPPTGPVFMALPIDLQMQACGDLELGPIRLPDQRLRPPREAVCQAARLLAQANSPAILAGSRVVEAGASGELAALAELLGAPVFSESLTSHGRLPLPADHPLYAQALPLWSPDVRRQLDGFDVLLVVGMNLLRQYIYHEPARAIPEQIQLVQVDEDPWQLNKNYPAEVAVIGHPQVALAELAGQLRELMGPAARAQAQRRGERHAAAHEAARRRLREEMAAEQSARLMTPGSLMAALAAALPEDAAVVDEAVTTANTMLERLGVLRDPAGYFGHRGWALGWGMGCAVGVRLAWPDRPVLGMVGDGAALYGIQALWSAAHYRLPVTFVVCNNAQYQILKMCGRQLGLPQAMAGRFVGCDLTEPEIDFISLARGFGVPAHRISDPEELTQRVRRSLAEGQLVLYDVPLANGSLPSP